MKDPIEPLKKEAYERIDLDWIEEGLNDAMCPQFARYLGRILLYQHELIKDLNNKEGLD